MSSQSWVIGTSTFSESYSYNDPDVAAADAPKDGSLKSMTTATGATIDYSYDELKRLDGTTVKLANSSPALYTTDYDYLAKNGKTTPLVNSYSVSRGTTSLASYIYTYDELGNITQISTSAGANYPLVKYTYDDQNQLLSEVYYDGEGNGQSNITNTYTYTYDTAGNLLSKSDGTDTTAYTYGNSTWQDLLTAYDGGKLAYEGQTVRTSTNKLTGVVSYIISGAPKGGNPILYYNGVHYDMQWEQGRSLSQSCYKTEDHTASSQLQWVETENTSAYSYDADGIRTGKTTTVDTYRYKTTSGGVEISPVSVENWGQSDPEAITYTRFLASSVTENHSYVTQNGKVVRETIGSGTSAKVLDFIYDESGRPFALIYTNGTATPITYYYILNLQGDVIQLNKADGTVVARYSYNAWGEIITSSGTMADVNPLRYRGYYYDSETGFYYLQSRYYDPVTHRFINADSYASTDMTSAIACNMFAYCNNNPVICADSHGTDAIIVIDNNAAEGAGHIGFLVQDENGNWTHFYWGPYGKVGTGYCVTFSYVYPETWSQTYGGELSLDAINASGQYSGSYDKMIYLEGDFSESAEKAKKTSVWTEGFYHLGINNCSQVSLRILSKSDTPYADVLKIASRGFVPNLVFNSLADRISELNSRRLEIRE